MTRMTCAEATLRTMADLGYTKFFNIPGRGIYPLLEELPKLPELEYVTGLHEFPLAAIADGYVRASGQPAFVNLYMSTGVLNAASSIFLSQRDRIPMVVTATQAESWALGADHRAEISDIVAAMRPVTKWAWMPPSPDRVPEALLRAHTIATTPPMGPVFVAIPVDYWTAEVDYRAPVVTRQVEPDVRPEGSMVSALADELASATDPVLVVGCEAVAAGASGAVEQLAELLGAAVVAEPEPGRLPIGSDSPFFAGSVAEAVEVIGAADVVVHVGTNSYEAFHAKIFDDAPNVRHSWIGTDGREVNKVVQVGLSAIGPITPVLEALVDRLRKLDLDADTVSARRVRLHERIAAEKLPVLRIRDASWDEEPLSVARVVSQIRSAMPPETVVLDHSTTAVRLVREFFPVPRGEQYVSASGSCQGWGIGAAVGVQLADPGTPVVGFVGDGGFLFGLQAWWTAAVEGLPLLAVVLDNGGWSSMRGSLTRNSPSVEEAGLELNFGWDCDVAAIARGFGGEAIDVHTAEELTAVLSERLPLSAPLLLNVHVRRETKTSASPFVGY